MAEDRTAESMRLWVPIAAAALGIAGRVGRAVWSLVRRVDRLESEAVSDEALAPHLAAIRGELRTLSAEQAALGARVAALEAKTKRGRR